MRRIAYDDGEDPEKDHDYEENLYDAPMKLATESEERNYGYSEESDGRLEPEGENTQKWIKAAASNFGMITDSPSSDVDDGIDDWKSYDSSLVHPETPDWLKIEIFNAKKAAIKKRRRTLQREAQGFRSGLPFYWVHGPGVKKTKAWVKKYKEYVKAKHPSFKNIMAETEAQLKMAPPEIRRKVEHDEKYQNYHFEPQYLNQEFTLDTFLDF